MSYVKFTVPFSGVYAIDETRVRLVKGRYYYVWIVRDVKTKGIPSSWLIALGVVYTSW